MKIYHCEACGVKLGPMPATEDCGYGLPKSKPVLYCSFECSGGKKPRGTQKKHLGPGQRGRPVRVYCRCSTCGKPYLRERGHMKPSSSGRGSTFPHRFCSRSCRSVGLGKVRTERIFKKDLHAFLDKLHEKASHTSARQVTAYAIKKGWLLRRACEVCGKEHSPADGPEGYVDAHHDDYAKPLDVRWLCQKHHREHHREHHQAEPADD